MFQEADKRFKFLFSGFGEDEFAMLLVVFDSHPPFFEFFKSAVVNTELYRLDELEGFNYSKSLVEYLYQRNPQKQTKEGV